MPRKDDSGEDVVSESGNWNVAADFAREKIMRPLLKCDYYEDIAKFGYESIIEELMGMPIPNDYVKYTGLKRLIEELIKLCNNAKFAMKILKTKETLNKHKTNLTKLKSALETSKNIKSNASTKSKTLTLNNKKFESILDLVLEIKSEINEPLNMNHLIFTDKTEFDPSSFKQRIKERILNKG